MNLWAIFVTGLFVGGLTCLAVQGGLLAATIAQREQEKLQEQSKKTNSALPILSFLVAKLAAYTVLGFLLGLLGSVLQLSLTMKVILQFAVVLFMIGTALNLLHVHPIFRYFVIQPPRFLTRRVRNQSKSKDFFAPALLGAFTVFIPCGTTQAMMVLAVGSGSPFVGAAILFAFVLGTSPLFFLLGYFATKLGDTLHKHFMRFAAFAIILLALFNLNNTVALTGNTISLRGLWQKYDCEVSFCDTQPLFPVAQAAQASGTAPAKEASITIEATGYNPNKLAVAKGSAVTLNLVNKGGSGCTQAFTIPKLGIQKVIPIGKSDTVAFTAPTQPGELAFMCGMGMFRGTITVI